MQVTTVEGGTAVPRDADTSALLDAALRLGQTQLQLQIADEASLDGRTMGLLAFNGALVAADVAAKSVLDRDWWTILPAVGLSAALCLLSALAKTSDVGVEAYEFFTEFGAGPSLLTREALLADLHIAFRRNARRVRIKTWSLRIALVSLAVGFAVAAFLISGELSNRIKICQAHRSHVRNSSQRLCRPHRPRGSRTSVPLDASSSGQISFETQGCALCSSLSIEPRGELLQLAREIEGSRRGALVTLAETIEAG